MLQFLRKVRLTAKGKGGEIIINAGGLNKHDLKISFDVEKTISSTQNVAEIKIWNLSEAHRNALGKELDDITLEAGYTPPEGGDNVGIIFKGQIRDVEHSRDGPDIITTLSTGDGDKGYRNATISKTYKAGTKVEEVVDDMYKELEKEGVAKGEFKFPDTMKPFKRPYTTVGAVKREMDLLGRSKNFYWSIQNGAMEIIPGDGFVGGITLISPETGMVGTPTITDNGVKVAALLNPEIRPGRRVRIESQTLEMNSEGGEYRVGEARYSGDNRDGDFIVFVVAEAIKGGKVDEGTKNEGAQYDFYGEPGLQGGR